MQEKTGEIVAIDAIQRRFGARGLSAAQIDREMERLRDGEQEEFVSIPDEDLARVEGMNRHDRRAYAAQERARQKAARRR